MTLFQYLAKTDVLRTTQDELVNATTDDERRTLTNPEGPDLILAFEVEEEILRQRVEQRTRTNEDVSDATVSVLEEQLENHEPISEEEQAYTIVIDTSGKIDFDTIVEQVRNKTCADQNNRESAI